MPWCTGLVFDGISLTDCNGGTGTGSGTGNGTVQGSYASQVAGTGVTSGEGPAIGSDVTLRATWYLICFGVLAAGLIKQGLKKL